MIAHTHSHSHAYILSCVSHACTYVFIRTCMHTAHSVHTHTTHTHIAKEKSLVAIDMATPTLGNTGEPEHWQITWGRGWYPAG